MCKSEGKVPARWEYENFMNSDISKLDKMQSSGRLKLDLFLPELIAFIMSNFLVEQWVTKKFHERSIKFFS